MSEKHRKVEFGDFQTPLDLATIVCNMLQKFGVCPGTVIEPSCGEGTFLEAAARVFGKDIEYYGFDINSEYVSHANKRMLVACAEFASTISTQDFFDFDWKLFVQGKDAPLLFLGNLPWVTNSSLGNIGASNMPEKSNIKGLNGLNARTGKSNFDISEWMLLKLVESAKDQVFTIAMLCKTGVARKVLEHCWKNGSGPVESALYRFSAADWFGASVDACLFYAVFGPGSQNPKNALVYETLDRTVPPTRFGLVDGGMVSSVDDYNNLKYLSGINYYRWRSGIKHDLVKVMELSIVGRKLHNEGVLKTPCR